MEKVIFKDFINRTSLKFQHLKLQIFKNYKKREEGIT
jgi:hypothetical protein